MLRDLAVATVTIAALVPYAENARTHSDEQVAQIAASIAEFGFVNPVLVDVTGVLVASHGRVMAAKRLGMAAVPAIRLAHLTEGQACALRLADNQIALNSEWDEALLAAEIARIRDEAVVAPDFWASPAWNSTGCWPRLGPRPLASSPRAIPTLRCSSRRRIPSAALMICGCFDRIGFSVAMSAADVARLLDGAKPHLMMTDLAYGVNYGPEWRNEAGVSATMRTGKVTNDGRADWRAA